MGRAKKAAGPKACAGWRSFAGSIAATAAVSAAAVAAAAAFATAGAGRLSRVTGAASGVCAAVRGLTAHVVCDQISKYARGRFGDELVFAWSRPRAQCCT